MKLREYLKLDGLGLAQLVQSKQVQPQELLNLALERSQQCNDKLNAITIPMTDYAKAKTQQALTGSFAGVPFLAKDLYQEYAGVPTTFGCKGLKRLNYVPDFSSELVQRWEKTGVVTLGRTNTPEFGLKGITEPDAFGSCKNPWYLKHNSGGSSGGSASAVAAGIVPIAGAGDGGGSIRIPASYCGLFGLKPSRGRTPWGPQLSEAMHGAVAQHILSKSVRDSAAMLDATHGVDHAALFEIQAPSASYLSCTLTAPKRLKIGFSTRSPIGTKVSQDAVDAIHQTVKLLESLGHVVEQAEPNIDGMQLAKDFTLTWFSQTASAVRQLKSKMGLSDKDFELDTIAIQAFGAQYSAMDYLENLDRWGGYVFQMNQFFSQYDLYLTPCTASVAPKNGEVATPAWQKPLLKGLLAIGQAHQVAKGRFAERMIEDNLTWVPFTQLANITGLPAMSVPLYWNKHNLPLGSQFVAPFGREDVLFQLAAQLEQAQPWWAQYDRIKV